MTTAIMKAIRKSAEGLVEHHTLIKSSDLEVCFILVPWSSRDTWVHFEKSNSCTFYKGKRNI